MSNAENYQRITDTIISLVEKGGLLPWQKEYATGAWGAAADLKFLTAWNKRADRWFALCDELSAARVAHVASPTPATAAWEAAALAAWSKGRMPSKNSKYTAYGHAHRLVNYLALDVPHAQNREDLKAIAALVMSNMVGNNWADLKFVP